MHTPPTCWVTLASGTPWPQVRLQMTRVMRKLPDDPCVRRVSVHLPLQQSGRGWSRLCASCGQLVSSGRGGRRGQTLVGNRGEDREAGSVRYAHGTFSLSRKQSRGVPPTAGWGPLFSICSLLSCPRSQLLGRGPQETVPKFNISWDTFT